MAVVQPLEDTDIAAELALAGYIVPETDEVRIFLSGRPQLRPVLSVAPDRINQTFGQKLPLRLRIFQDREERSCAELVMEILTGNSGSDAWVEGDRKLWRLHELWLAALPREVTREILFVTEPGQMAFDRSDYLDLAKALAHRSEQAALRAAISRAYYAALGKARGLLECDCWFFTSLDVT